MLSLYAIAASAQAEIASNLTSNTQKVWRTPDVDTKPQLKNGLNELSAFIGNQYKFPEIKNKKIKIFVSFIVEPDGTMTDIKAFYISVKDWITTGDQVKIETEAEKEHNAKQSEQLKNEAARVIKAFPEKWIPAKKDGQLVRCLYNYPINFNIE